MSTKTIIYRFCLVLKKAIKKRFKAALKALDTSTLDTQEKVLQALLEA